VALISTPLSLLTFALKGDWNVNPQEILQANLALLFDKATTSKALYAFASSIDLFSFWTMFILASGYAAATRKSTSAALFGVLGLWAVYVLCKVGLALIF
jgi:hypothetical protein